MKYYLVAGEASGDLHASRLMHEIKLLDNAANFRFFGGDLMKAEGGVLVRHYRDMAFMGFIDVARNLRTIMKLMDECRRDIREFAPDAVILVDYPGFNLKIARYVKQTLGIKVHYYIAPKIWAWKEYRIKNIRRYVDFMYSILPFEPDYFARLGYRVDYVGNPTVDELAVRPFADETFDDFVRDNSLSSKPIIALVSGSRVGEIKGSLPRMIESARHLTDYQLVVAGAPGISPSLYASIIGDLPVTVLYDRTHRLMKQAAAALVTSGTATLEAAVIGVPQVVCYHVFGGRVTHKIFEYVLRNISYVSLVNLIADRPVVKELLAHHFNPRDTRNELERILTPAVRAEIAEGYAEVRRRLGGTGAARRAAALVVERAGRHNF